MSQIERTIILTGAHAGKTLTLGKFRAVDGKITLRGSPSDVEGWTLSIERNWCGNPEGDPRLNPETDNGQRDLSQGGALPNGTSDVSGAGQSGGEGAGTASAVNGGGADAGASGSTGELAGGNGQQADVNMKLANAIRALDADNDEHWTQDGKPAIAAIQNVYGQTGFTRKDVEAAVPNFTRDVARADKAAEVAGKSDEQ